MTSGADLFVVCKQCGSEVSPYITECPYCGHRLRRRAPKLPRAHAPTRSPRRRAGISALLRRSKPAARTGGAPARGRWRRVLDRLPRRTEHLPAHGDHRPAGGRLVEALHQRVRVRLWLLRVPGARDGGPVRLAARAASRPGRGGGPVLWRRCHRGTGRVRRLLGAAGERGQRGGAGATRGLGCSGPPGGANGRLLRGGPARRGRDRGAAAGAAVRPGLLGSELAGGRGGRGLRAGRGPRPGPDGGGAGVGTYDGRYMTMTHAVVLIEAERDALSTLGSALAETDGV